MKIAITDANIFIDLIYVGLLSELFDIDIEIHTTLNVIDELNVNQQKTILRFEKKNKLTIHQHGDFFLPDSIKKNKKLSDSDKSVFSLALELKALVLTGDSVLRNVSGIQKIEVHGTLWLIDQFLEKKLITKKKAAQQLKQLRAYNRRLPHDDCEQRISEWS